MLWIIGKSNRQLNAYLSSKHIPYGLLHDAAFPLPATDALQVIHVDFSSEEAIINSVSNEHLAVDGFLLAGYEQYVEPFAVLREFYNVPGPSKAAAKAARDKSVMREAFQRADPEISPAWQKVQSFADIEAFMQTHALPLVLKPTGLAKSQFVSINHTTDELQQNYEAAKHNELIVEEFLDGSMHTVIGFVDGDGTISLSDVVVDCIMAQDLGVNDSFIAERTIPSSLSETDTAALLDVARRGVTALGLRGVALHIELMKTKDGPKIIEIAARLGGYRARMYDLASDIDIYGSLVANSTNHSVTLKAFTHKYCTVIELFPTADGELVSVDGLDELRSMSATIAIKQKMQPGQVVGKAANGNKAVVVVMLHHADKDQHEAARTYAETKVRITVNSR